MQQQLSAAGLKALVEDAHESFDTREFRIGDLSREFGVTLRALRFYEDRGLLKPRRSGSTRLYSADDRQRLKLILLSKRFGLSLVEIQEVLRIHDAGTVSNEGISKILDKFKAQANVLRVQRDDLDKAMIELEETIRFIEKQV